MLRWAPWRFPAISIIDGEIDRVRAISRTDDVFDIRRCSDMFE